MLRAIIAKIIDFKNTNMDFSFVIVNALPQIQPAESFFVWWRVLSWIVIVVCPLCLAYYFRKDNKYQKKDYLILTSILVTFIVIYYSLNSGLTLISGLLAVYALFYSTMSANYSARKIVINSWAEKATDHLMEYKDSTLAAKVASMQLVDKPNYFKVRDVLWYRSNKQELAEKKLDVSYADDKLIIKIDGEIIPESEYMVGSTIEWIKIYAKLDIEQYAVELIKKEFEVMAKNDVFAGIENENGKWTNKAKLQALWLHGADLNVANLQGAHLWRAHLQGAHLNWAHLQGAYLNFAELQGAHLFRAHLEYANLQGAYLESAQLQGTFLDGAQLQGAVIKYYNKESEKFEVILLTEAILEETDKYKDDLPNFTGLEGIDSAIFSDHEETDKKVIAKIKQKHNL